VARRDLEKPLTVGYKKTMRMVTSACNKTYTRNEVDLADRRERLVSRGRREAQA
jgi:hypothetical protein